MSSDQVRYPGPGCVVEFMQGNTPLLAVVLEEQSGRLRAYTQGKREVNLTQARVLPWFGPMAGASMSRLQMEQLMEQVGTERDRLASEIHVEELWELAQGEVFKASAAWLASLIWSDPGINHMAAVGHVLLECKTHFRFAPPEFEIFTKETVEKRLEEAEQIRIREVFAGKGATFFLTLWDIHLFKRPRLQNHEQPDPELEQRLRTMLLERIADPECTTDEVLWRMLVKPLPEHPHLPLLLATAWGIVPEHHNFYFDRCGFEPGTEWSLPFADDIRKLQERAATILESLPPLSCEDNTEKFIPLISIDPGDSLDKDDAFWVNTNPDGSYKAVIALACPALSWDFSSALDKAVFRRQSSIYLPEGDEHMLPPEAGWKLFSLDSNQLRPSLVIKANLASSGKVIDYSVFTAKVQIAQNFCLNGAEQALHHFTTEPAAQDSASVENDQAIWQNFLENQENAEPISTQYATLPDDHPAHTFKQIFKSAHTLSQALQKNRIANGAVITERVDPEIILGKTVNDIQVSIRTPQATPKSFLIIGELMILANTLLADWATARELPVIFRVQDVTIPKEYAGVWSHPADISRVVRGLPGATLDVEPKRHAGLGIAAYTSATSPIRRYLDLVNQSQLVSFMQTGKPRLSVEELKHLLPLMSARLDGVMQVQRMRPRYWKLLHLRQVGAKAWWAAVVTEENNYFAGVTLPIIQLYLRGKRHLFPDKLNVGQAVQVRIGKVTPLLGEMSIAETRETE